ncbi:hypothetical protein B0E42_14645 [Pseudomonas sp. A25(2017)]|nr:hypothetical protein B0E42_14645 [Pseudomonas sp. A25(2017)]
MWERACSRKRSVRQLIWRLIHRFREQARSHTVFRLVGIWAAASASAAGRWRCAGISAQAGPVH